MAVLNAIQFGIFCLGLGVTAYYTMDLIGLLIKSRIMASK